MTKLTYTNDQQLINDAAQMLIEAHLSWSGSNEGMPSSDKNCIGGRIYSAYLKANSYEDASDEEKAFLEAEAAHLYKRARQLADKKWEAAMTLLGIEA